MATLKSRTDNVFLFDCSRAGELRLFKLDLDWYLLTTDKGPIHINPAFEIKTISTVDYSNITIAVNLMSILIKEGLVGST